MDDAVLNDALKSLNDRFALEAAVGRVFALPEMWTLFADCGCWSFVEAWRMTGVCRASNVGLRDWLGGLRRLVVCGGSTSTGRENSRKITSEEAWRLDLGKLQWERMADLRDARNFHGCCTIRGNVVVIWQG